jgi:hypothetical protein
VRLVSLLRRSGGSLRSPTESVVDSVVATSLGRPGGRDLVATSLGRVDWEGAHYPADIEKGVEQARAVECGLPTGLGQSGVDDRRDRGFRRGVADGSAHAVEEIEGLGPGQELMAGCATDGCVHQCDERRLANRLYVALMLVSPHDETTAVGVDGIAVLPRGTRSGFGSEPDSGGTDTTRAGAERRNSGGKANRAPLQCVTRVRSPRGTCLPTAPHPALQPERHSCQEPTRPLILVVARSRHERLLWRLRSRMGRRCRRRGLRCASASGGVRWLLQGTRDESPRVVTQQSSFWELK